MYVSHDIRNTWIVSESMCDVVFLEKGIRQIAAIGLWNANKVKWKAKLTYLGVKG